MSFPNEIARYDVNDIDYRVNGDYLVITKRWNIDAWADKVLRCYSSKFYCRKLGAGVVVARERQAHSERPLKIGVARCNCYKDEYNADIGFAIAICRALDLKIPREIFKK